MADGVVFPRTLMGLARGLPHAHALNAAVKLGVFTTLAEDNVNTASALAKKLGGSERGFRILLDLLVVKGLLTKNIPTDPSSPPTYHNTPEASAFLVRTSPQYMGDAFDFHFSPFMVNAMLKSDQAVLTGTQSTESPEGSVSDNNEVWDAFARGMKPVAAISSALTVKAVMGADPEFAAKPAGKILDIAASHGQYGLAFAKLTPHTTVTAVDWESVLRYAKDTFAAAGLSDRLSLLPGDAFKVDFGTGYDLVLVANFFHHFDTPTNIELMKKLHSCLQPGGRVVTVEFVPNEDRVTPPDPAAFAWTMLLTTPKGDAYTFREYDAMFTAANFKKSVQVPLPSSSSVIISYK